jgi:pyruvate,water dikinase
MLRRALLSTALHAAAREATKATFVRCLEPARLALRELAQRHRIDRAELFLLTIDELPRFVRDPHAFAATLVERRAVRDGLQARVPPFWFEGEVPPPDTWPLRAERRSIDTTPRTLTGMGVCPGTATGPARVITDPSAPGALEPGDILVAPITDPAWTPLFLAVAGVVVDVGAQQSHAAIIARELGIPAVVSVPGASLTIADGTTITVDGTHGTVTVHPILSESRTVPTP